MARPAFRQKLKRSPVIYWVASLVQPRKPLPISIAYKRTMPVSRAWSPTFDEDDAISLGPILPVPDLKAGSMIRVPI